MSLAAHEFENYLLQRKTAAKVSFLALAIGGLGPDLFTKFFVYHVSPENAARFHRGFPGVGFSHSLFFGVVLALLVLRFTRSRTWALGLMIGLWAHVLTDTGDTAGVMIFFPFSLEPVSFGMWRHYTADGPYGDAAAYYSSLGGVWDFFWMGMTLLFARVTLTGSYFRRVVVPADARAWRWIQRHTRLPERALLLLYQGLFFYAFARMTTWFLLARLQWRTPFQPTWGGPAYTGRSNDLSDASVVEVFVRTAIGGVFFAAFLALCWHAFIRRWWAEADDPSLIRDLSYPGRLAGR